MLAYDRTGSGEPIVLIHGIGHNRRGWDPIVPLLVAEGFEVITVDLPGHGESPAYESNGAHAREYLGEVFEKFYAELGVERPHVVGNSLGGLIALQGGLNGHSRSVTCLSPAGFWKGDLDFLYVRGLFRTMITAAGLLKPVAPQLLRTRLGRTLAFSWLSARPAAMDPEALIHDHASMLRARPAIAQLFQSAYKIDRNLPVPTTIAWAEHDKVLLPYQANVARSILTEATHLRIDGVGHVPMADDPEQVARIIVDAARAASATTEAAA